MEQKLKYYDTPDATPVIAELAVKEPKDWETLEFNPNKPGLGTMLEAMKIIRGKVGDNLPIMGRVVSPMTVATWIAGMSQVIKDVRKNPELLHKGLKIITELMRGMVDAELNAGATFFLMLCTRASKDILTLSQYEEFGAPYDLKVLEYFKRKNVPVMVHVCGNVPMLDKIIPNYPIDAINWWDRGTGRSLFEIKQAYGNQVCLAGGLDQNGTLLFGNPEEVEVQAKEAIMSASKGGGFILSGGCELSAITPPENIHAAVRAAKKYGKYS